MLQTLKNAKILIADASGTSLANTHKILNNNGYTNIILATNGKGALELINTAAPDLVIFDASLPDISGIDLCKKLRNSDKHIGTRILIKSSDNELKEQAFNAGANDFISQSTDIIEFMSRIKAHLYQSYLYKSLIENNNRMVMELNSAKNTLESLLPNNDFIKTISEKNNISISTYYRPSSELGGDFFDIIDCGKGKIIFYLWDFSGHGINAAINTFRLHCVISREYDKHMIDPGTFLTSMNQTLYKLLPKQHYATMFYGLVDLNKRILEYSCASCPPPILISFKEKKGELIDSQDFPLGVKSNHVYKTKTLSIKNWDSLILYSDALIETPKNDNKFLTPQEIVNNLIKSEINNKNINALKVKELILNQFNNQCSSKISDDLTLEVLNFN